MNEFFLALVLGPGPAAGWLLFAARRLVRSGGRELGLVMAWVAVAIAVGQALMLAYTAVQLALDADLGSAFLLVFMAAIVVTLVVLVVREIRSVGLPQPDRDSELNVWWLACAFIVGPGLLVLVAPVLAGMFLVYGVYLWHRWRRMKQANLLTLLTGVVELKRPPTEVFRPQHRVSGAWNRRINDFGHNLDAGMPYSDAGEQSQAIAPRDIVLLRAAELTDSVERELPSLALQSRRRLRDSWYSRGVLAPAIYLQILASVIFTIVSFLMYWIVPKFKYIFEDFGVELPAVTRSLITASNHGMTAFPVWLTALVAWLVAIVASSLVAVSGAPSMPAWLLAFGPRRWSTPTVLRVLATIVESGKAATGPLDELAQRSKHMFWHLRWSEVRDHASSGIDLAKVLTSTHDLTPREADGLAAASLTGQLTGQAAYLRALADGIESRGKQTASLISTSLSGVLFTLLAALSAFVCVGFFSGAVNLAYDLS